jgi:PAS domain S-box-containing protein
MIKGNYHRLLRRQIKDHLDSLTEISKADLEVFLDVVNLAYLGFDQDIAHIENILAQSSHELFRKNKELNNINSNLSITVDKKTAHLTKASYNLKNAEKIAKLGNFTWDINNRRLELSDQLIRMFDEHQIDFSKGIKHIIKHFEGSEEAINDIINAVKTKSYFIFDRAKLAQSNAYFYIEGRIVESSTDGSLIIGIFQDISKIVIAEQKNNDIKAFYETVLNSLPPNILVFDRKQNYLFINPSIIPDKNIREQLIGKNYFDCIDITGLDITIAIHTQNKFYDAITQKKEIKWEETVIAKNGEKKSILKHLVPILDSENNVSIVIGYGIDITERTEMTEKQILLTQQLSHQNEQLNDFCNIVSHNLRGPLVNISMLIKFIQEANNEAEKKDMIDKVEPVINSLNEIFNELVESLQVKLDNSVKLEKNDFHKNIKLICRSLEIEIEKSKAEIIINCEDAPTLRFPSKYLKSILHNLISNALKYKSLDRTPRIEIKTKRFKNNILLSVNDNGLGIDLNRHKNNVFKIGKVFHKHPSAKGFGLHMTRTQVESMNGRIWVESTPNVGSTFFIEFVNQ